MIITVISALTSTLIGLCVGVTMAIVRSQIAANLTATARATATATATCGRCGQLQRKLSSRSDKIRASISATLWLFGLIILADPQGLIFSKVFALLQIVGTRSASWISDLALTGFIATLVLSVPFGNVFAKDWRVAQSLGASLPQRIHTLIWAANSRTLIGIYLLALALTRI